MDMPEMTSSGIRHRNISEPSSSVVIERPQHATSLLVQLNAMRSDNNSVDTILIADGTEFPCHRAVLSASSQYFRMMFGGRLRESHERRIMFDGVTALALGRLIDYVYSGQIKVLFLLYFCCLPDC
jgi:BTB/POZ domain